MDIAKHAAFCGVRLGSLKVIEPQLPNDDNRIGRQQGVFVAGYNPRDAAAVTIDRIYFRQQPGIIFEDPRAGVTRLDLMPEAAPARFSAAYGWTSPRFWAVRFPNRGAETALRSSRAGPAGRSTLR